MKQCDEDEFWQVVMESEDPSRTSLLRLADSQDPELGSSVDVDDDCSAEEFQPEFRFITYRIPWRNSNLNACSANVDDLHLKLSPLPDSDGVWSPLGAQAWYASALLVAYVLQSTVRQNPQDTDTETVLSRSIKSWFADANNQNASFRALELGSGAVGLAGIVMGFVLADHATLKPPLVILTDNETNVLQNLKHNVNRAEKLWQAEAIKKHKANHRPPAQTPSFPEFSVQNLEWNSNLSSELYQGDHKLQLIFGSELVYTGETAEACAKIVLDLLQANPDALVFILQVTDRDGWTNVFLPMLRQKHHLQMIEESIDDSDLHELAETVVPAGGTLDRFAFGGCYVFQSAGRIPTLFGDDSHGIT